MMPDLIITSGEPAGIGPDIVASIDPTRFDARLIVIGDRDLLESRARMLGKQPRFVDFGTADGGTIEVIHEALDANCRPGELDPANARYVLRLLERAGRGCLDGEFDAMVTAPVQKEIINRAGIDFSGHTEYLAELCGAGPSVMLLIAAELRVALVTTHLALRAVPDAITEARIREVATTLDRGLRERFGIATPQIKVCGLNPHAGEGGFLGREEIDVIVPALDALRAEGLNLTGPYPADTLFTPGQLADADAVLAMYHDQGLPVLKHKGFHNAVNTTLGLPIIRTSVDHGTALALAGSGRAVPDSLFAAIDSALLQVGHRQRHGGGA